MPPLILHFIVKSSFKMYSLINDVFGDRMQQDCLSRFRVIVLSLAFGGDAHKISYTTRWDNGNAVLNCSHYRI